MEKDPDTPSPDERLKSLVHDLAMTLNEVFPESDAVREAISRIEQEGYEVELIMASITRILRRNKETGESSLAYEFNAFDRDFLREMKILPPEEKGGQPCGE